MDHMHDNHNDVFNLMMMIASGELMTMMTIVFDKMTIASCEMMTMMTIVFDKMMRS